MLNNMLIFVFSGGGFRPLEGSAPRAAPPLFFPPHLSHLTHFSQPLFPALKGNYKYLIFCYILPSISVVL